MELLPSSDVKLLFADVVGDEVPAKVRAWLVVSWWTDGGLVRADQKSLKFNTQRAKKCSKSTCYKRADIVIPFNFKAQESKSTWILCGNVH